MISKISLIAVLSIAGIIHLFKPEVFLPAIPPFLPGPFIIIYFTGILELLLAIGLSTKKFQDISAQYIALYFILLIPVHVFIAAEGIPIFNVDHRGLLWLRCIFQFVFIFWALSLQTRSWIIEQVWKHVIFLHYKISPELIEKKVPFKLDLYEGQAVVSIVPFFMEKIRFPFFPAIPKLSSLWELNIRTYVEVNGVKGVYFFTLETDSKIGELIAQKFFSLPYRFAKIRAFVKNRVYTFSHHREKYHFHISGLIGEEKELSNFEIWATERYRLFTLKHNTIYEGVVIHKPWKLNKIEINEIDTQFIQMVFEPLPKLYSASYTHELKVRFRPFNSLLIPLK